jgi:hypothetical protein
MTHVNARLRAGLRRQQRPLQGLGAALVLLGAGYDGWALLRFDPRASAEAHASFDLPVSSLSKLYSAYAPLLRVARPKTELESICVRGMQGHMAFSVGISMTLVRVLLGTLAAVLGLAILAVVGERRRLLDMVDHLLAAPSAPPPPS